MVRLTLESGLRSCRWYWTKGPN